VGFDTILNKEVVAMDSIANVVLDSEIVHSVDGDDSGVRLMNCITASERIGNRPSHVEVNTISAWYLRLSALSKLSESNLSLKTVSSLASHHEMRSIQSN
jgi:hypothetical protein